MIREKLRYVSKIEDDVEKMDEMKREFSQFPNKSPKSSPNAYNMISNMQQLQKEMNDLNNARDEIENQQPD